MTFCCSADSDGSHDITAAFPLMCFAFSVVVVARQRYRQHIEEERKVNSDFKTIDMKTSNIQRPAFYVPV